MSDSPNRNVWIQNQTARDGEVVEAIYIASQYWRPITGHRVVASQDEAVDGIQSVTLGLVSGRHALLVPWSIIVEDA